MMLPRVVVLSVDGETGGDDGHSSMSAACAPRLWSFGSAGLGVGWGWAPENKTHGVDLKPRTLQKNPHLK